MFSLNAFIKRTPYVHFAYNKDREIVKRQHVDELEYNEVMEQAARRLNRIRVLSRIVTALLSMIASATVVAIAYILILPPDFPGIPECLGAIAMVTLFLFFHPFFVWVGWPFTTFFFFCGYCLHVLLEKKGKHRLLHIYRLFVGGIVAFLAFCMVFINFSPVRPW